MRLNKLADPCFDYEAIERNYSFYRFECNSYRQRTNICDYLKANAPVLSVRNSSNFEGYFVDVMALPGHDDIIISMGTSEESSKGKVTVRKIRPESLSVSDLMQLMMSALSSNDLSDGPSNASGNFYLIVKENTNKKRGMVSEIVALEFKVIDRDYSGSGRAEPYLTIHVRTFTNYKLKDYISFTKENPAESYPKYVKDGPCLKRYAKGDTGDCFILRRIGNAKSSVHYYSFDNYDKLRRSKAGLIFEIQEVFNLRYSGLARMVFSEVPVGNVIRPNKSHMEKKYEEQINRIMRMKSVCIINPIGEDGKEISAAIENRFRERGFVIIDGTVQCFNVYIVKIIHNRQYYLENEIRDPHIPVLYSSVQHVTVEDFDSSAAAIDVVATNLAIKSDILDGSISITDWTFGKLSFAIKLDDDRTMDAEYAMLTVGPGGTLDFGKFTVRDTPNFALASVMMEKDVAGAIVKGDDVNIIRETDIFTVPDTEKVRKKMKENEKEGIALREGIRSKEGRMEYLEEMIDINLIPLNGSRLLYTVGYVGYGISTMFERAVRVRLVEAADGSELFFNDILELMDVYFVRHKQLTVLPYPFKYLREWCYLNGLLDEDDSDQDVAEGPEAEE